MDVVHVVFELVLAFEGGTAVRAAERTHLGVDDHVLGQSFLDAKGLVADHTAVRFLSWMNQNEQNEINHQTTPLDYNMQYKGRGCLGMSIRLKEAWPVIRYLFEKKA